MGKEDSSDSHYKGCLRAFSVNDKGETYCPVCRGGLVDWNMYNFLIRASSTLYIEALEECELWQIDRPGLEELYLKIPKLERFLELSYKMLL